MEPARPGKTEHQKLFSGAFFWKTRYANRCLTMLEPEISDSRTQMVINVQALFTAFPPFKGTLMEYGLRQYEARQRLMWFLFFLFCLLIAFPAKGIYLASVSRNPLTQTNLDMLKSMDFWHHQQWVHVGPIGNLLTYLVWVLALFVGIRVVWLLLQMVGKGILAQTLPKTAQSPKENIISGKSAKLPSTSQRRLPESLTRWTQDLRHNLLRFVFHAHRRALFTFSNPQGVLIADDLADRQQRLADIDWQILNGSWVPYRWTLRLLPVLALFQTLWLVYLQVQPVLGGQRDLQELAGSLLPSVLPFVQVLILTLIFSLASGLVSRLENLYLANLDALFYDRLLSSMPIRSSDTILILEALQKHFGEVSAALERLQRSLIGK
jgi:hypothetical protein